MLIPAHLVIQPKGAVRSYSSQEEAWEAAGCLAGSSGDKGWVVENYADELSHNPPPDAKLALKLSALPQLGVEEVMRYSISDAWREIQNGLGKDFPRTSDYKTVGVFVGAATGAGLLRENEKLIKALRSGKGSTQVGLQLVPEYSVFRGHGSGNREKPFELQRLPLAGSTRKSTLCAGSSRSCRSACLTYAGQNVSPDAVHAKHVTTLMLLDHPAAFCRLLAEACLRFSRHAQKNKLYPYVRLNVLSDIPWELVFPGLFDYVKGRRRTVSGRTNEHVFYDYTKLVGRGPWAAKNYHITFSFSGVNLAACWDEQSRGTNVTVPFLHVHRADDGSIRMIGRRSGREEKDKSGKYKLKLPTVWEGSVGRGLPIMDGDKDDLRPLDKHAGSWVGLRYKAAAGIKDSEILRRVGAFVVNCWEDTDTGLFVAAETPGQTNVDTGR